MTISISNKESGLSVRNKLNDALDIITLVDSALDFNGPKVGIGTTAGAESLRVSGGLHADSANFVSLSLNDSDVTITASEINILGNITATASEINLLDGITATPSELNILDGVVASTSELNQLSGTTITSFSKTFLDDDSAEEVRNTLGLSTLATLEILNDSSLSSESTTRPPSEAAAKAYADAIKEPVVYLGSFTESAGELIYDFSQHEDSDYLYYDIQIAALKFFGNSGERSLRGQPSYDGGLTYDLSSNKLSSHLSATNNYSEFRFTNENRWGRDSSNGWLTGSMKYYPPLDSSSNPSFDIDMVSRDQSSYIYHHNGFSFDAANHIGMTHLKLVVNGSSNFLSLERSGHLRVYGVRKNL